MTQSIPRPAARALAALIGAGLAAASATAEPPYWEVTDGDSTLVLYPTIHFLPEGLDWQSPALKAAIDATGEVWFELPVGPDAEQAAAQAIFGAGLDPSRPLSQVLEAGLFERTKAAAATLGIDIAQLDAFRPWLVALTLTSVTLMQAGITPDAGVEPKLEAAAAAKPKRALETAEAQAAIFASMDESVQIAFLKETLDSLDTAAGELRAIAEAWAEGDVSLIDEMINGEFRTDYPDVFEVLFVKRNRNWAEQLDAELKGAGADFVAVGAGHLVGEDSVPDLLARRGYSVRLVTPGDKDS